MTTPKNREIKTPMFKRSFVLNTREADEEARTVPLSFSSEEPYNRYFGIEILSHEEGAVDLARLNDGAPLLKDHWRDEQIGVIESAWIEKKKGRAVVRFSKSQKGEEEFRDVLDGIRTKISVGYMIDEKTLIGEKDGVETYLVTKWTPLEISTVSIPADGTVGVGRKEDDEKKFTTSIIIPKKENRTMPEKDPKTIPTADFDAAAIQRAQDEGKAAAEAQYKRDLAKRDADTAEIIAIGERMQLGPEALQHIKEGKSVDDFKNFAMEKLNERNATPPNQEAKTIGMSRADRDKYSFMRAVRAVCLGPQDPKFIREAGFEFECAEAAAKIQGKEANGLIVPHDMLMHRTLTAGTATDGAELVADNLLAGSFIDVLRNRAISMALGATVMHGLVGNVLIPRQTSGAAAGWIATETGDAPEGEAQFDQVALNPKTAGVYTDLSRQLLMQSTPSAEMIVRNDLVKSMALLLDKAAFYASGASGQPTGIALQTGINAPASFAAAVATWPEVVAMETAIALDNALVGKTGYALEPGMRGAFKTTEKFSGTGREIMPTNNELNGYRAEVSNQIISGDMFFGNFEDLLIGFWGGLDMLVDPYTHSLKGTIRIVCHQSMDIAVRHPESFAFNNDGV